MSSETTSKSPEAFLEQARRMETQAKKIRRALKKKPAPDPPPPQRRVDPDLDDRPRVMLMTTKQLRSAVLHLSQQVAEEITENRELKQIIHQLNWIPSVALVSWIKDALDEVKSPTHHPDIGAPALKPMTPQERIRALGTQRDELLEAAQRGLLYLEAYAAREDNADGVFIRSAIAKVKGGNH